MPAWFALVITAVALLAGAVAAVAGTGVGSLVTPALSLRIDIRDAVLAVVAPHLVFNALRFWSVRSSISGKIFRRFGLTSAGGSLAGALFQHGISSGWITGIFALVLIIAGLFGVSGLADRVKFGRRGAYVGGALSGFFGGLTGEQGGLRAAAMLGLDLPKATLSHHFKVLRNAGVILARAEGTRHLISINRKALDSKFPGLMKSVLASPQD